MRLKQTWHINKDLLIYKCFYFSYFGALGAINPYLPVYLRQIGLSAVAVGLLVGIRPIIQLASAPFWTVVADKFRKRKVILIMSIMAWLIMTIALVFVEPTEEICEFVAKNSSHNVLLNYTKHKTGFFKRSTHRPMVLPMRLRRLTENLQGSETNAPPVHINGIVDNSQSKQTSKAKRKVTYTSRSHATTSKTQVNQYENFPPQPGKKRKIGKTLVSEQKEQRNLVNIVGKGRNLRTTKTRHAKNTSMEHDMAIQKQSEADAYKMKAKTGLSASDDVEMSTKLHPEVFDPFNMNGKSKSSTGARLAKFFARTHNKTQLTTTDVHYYNMNRAESQHGNSIEKTPHSSKVKYKHEKRRPSRNQTFPATNLRVGKQSNVHIGLAIKGKHTNETLRVIQTNLFKSNTNEMKRLFVILLVLIVVGEFLETPSAPLSDASLLEYLGENRIHYGKQRLWGSLGHGIASFLVGMLMERSRHLTCGEEFIDYTMSFSVFTVFMLLTLVISANFIFRYKDVETTDNSVLSTVLAVHYISFLIAVCYMGMCHGLIHNFLMWFIEDLGGSKTLMGLAICSRSSADLIMFFTVSKLIEVLGQIKIVFIALISYGTIFIAYSTMSNPWFAIGIEFLGGFTFASSWTACTSYLAEAAPQESVTTMQGTWV